MTGAPRLDDDRAFDKAELEEAARVASAGLRRRRVLSLPPARRPHARARARDPLSRPDRPPRRRRSRRHRARRPRPDPRRRGVADDGALSPEPRQPTRPGAELAARALSPSARAADRRRLPQRRSRASTRRSPTGICSCWWPTPVPNGSASARCSWRTASRARTLNTSASYLETQKVDNHAYYRRFGYELRDTVNPVAGGPPYYTMWRAAR